MRPFDNDIKSGATVSRTQNKVKAYTGLRIGAQETTKRTTTHIINKLKGASETNPKKKKKSVLALQLLGAKKTESFKA